MKTSKILVAVLALVLLALFVVEASNQPQKATPVQPKKTADSTKAVTSAPSAKQITWLSYDKGAVLSRQTNKFMFIDYTASWCGWCKKMEKETFSQQEVIDMLSKNFIPVKVWGDSDSLLDIDGYKISQKEYAASKGIQGYPTFHFEAPTREPLTGFSGYRDAPTLIQYLNQVKTYIDTAQALKNPTAKPAGK